MIGSKIEKSELFKKILNGIDVEEFPDEQP